MTGYDSCVQLIDLGLMTRVICHEINNLLANQRGYGNLLRQRGLAAPDAPRWLTELSGATLELQALVSALQLQSRRRGNTAPADRWPPEPAIKTIAAELAGMGSSLGETALQRMLTIIAAEVEATGPEWTAPALAPWPAGTGILGSAPATGSALILSIPDHGRGRSRTRWSDSASQILPPGEALPDAWSRALVLGLLRQCGGDLLEADDRTERFWLVIPTAYMDLEGDSY